MSARRSTSSTAPASSMTARCCSRAARRRSSPTRTSGASIWAKASSCDARRDSPTMSIGPRLDLRQSQSLVMTPQLQQAIKLLALSNLEIETFIAEELEKNPLLEAERGPAGDDEVPATPEPEFAVGEGAADPDALPEADAAGGDGALDVD